MIYDSTFFIQAKVEGINLESQADYSRITFNNLKFISPCLNELFTIMNADEVVEIEIKRLVK